MAGGVATGYKGGKFALVGPGWKGRLPPHVTRIESPTRWVLVQSRVHVVNRDDLPSAKAILDAITVEGLAKATGKPAPTAPAYHYAAPDFADPKLPVSLWPSRTRFSSGRFSPTVSPRIRRRPTR